MAPPPVSPVERLRMDAVQDLHASGELLPARVDDEVIVVAHQAERVAAPVEPDDDVCEECEEEPPVVVVEEDRNPAGPARADVKDPFVGHRVARQPCHGSKVIRSHVSSGACGPNVTLSSHHHPSNQAPAWGCPEPGLRGGGGVRVGTGTWFCLAASV